MVLQRDRRDLRQLLEESEGVLETAAVLTCLSAGELRWRVASGRWQQPFKGVVITQSGPLTDRQVLRLALLRAGPQAVLAGLTAARLDGFVGFGDKTPFADGPIHLINKSHRRLPRVLPSAHLIVHTVPGLGPGEVHPVKQPRRTRIERSIVDAAAWMPTERGAMAVLAAGYSSDWSGPTTFVRWCGITRGCAAAG
jgi:hypothetical protein